MFAIEMFSYYPSLCSGLLAAQCIKVMTGNMAKSSQRDKVMQCQGVSGKSTVSVGPYILIKVMRKWSKNKANL